MYRQVIPQNYPPKPFPLSHCAESPPPPASFLKTFSFLLFREIRLGVLQPSHPTLLPSSPTPLDIKASQRFQSLLRFSGGCIAVHFIYIFIFFKKKKIQSFLSLHARSPGMIVPLT
ncbi:hypothetical protein IE53DRAFT_108797 [Violaceomyces palustris]|uniref:Uncharacterized protein n=1 Tax=Violaceomyces palustris TaxID=1673888 RepID=A0ACD0P6W0_9BASI|nr:hypothetical protein IE53DRAFT_108797 [Violaceomyces palustris]